MSEAPTIKSERLPLLKEYKVPIETEVGLIKQTLSESNFEPLRKGDLIPEFSLSDFAGNRVKFSDLLDHGILVLSFNRGNLCGFCKMEVNTPTFSIVDKMCTSRTGRISP